MQMFVLQDNQKYVNDGANNELVYKCSDLMRLKGILALRIAYLCHNKMDELEIPPISIYLDNHYK